jgi:predicted GNAT superfamily acetyltransferase
MIRTATCADLDAVLALNAASAQVTSALDRAALAALVASAAVFTVVVAEGGEVAAFLLALREDARYDNANFRWFGGRYPRFLYIDRIIVGEGHRRRGHGDLLYRDLAGRGREAAVPLLAAEVNVDPPNPASLSFHERQGFAPVGQQLLPTGKTVVMLVKSLEPRD